MKAHNCYGGDWNSSTKV